MKNYSVKQYEPKDYILWNAFISRAKNATFLFDRNFIEYHQDRFKDFSLMVFEGEKLISLLPANSYNNEIYSHQGLTYGGFVFTEKIKMSQVLEVFQAVLHFLNVKQIKTLHLKLIPSIYNSYFSEEINYKSLIVYSLFLISIYKCSIVFSYCLFISLQFNKFYIVCSYY